MNYARVFRDVTLVTALAASGYAQAANTNQPDKDDTVPPALVSLSKRLVLPGNLPNVKSCFTKLGIEEKPVLLMNADDAQDVVKCTDTKIVQQFLDHPVEHHDAINTTVMYDHGYKDYNWHLSHAVSISKECRSSAENGLSAFATCASETGATLRLRETMISIGGVAFLGLLGAGLMVQANRRQAKQDQENRERRGFTPV